MSKTKPYRPANGEMGLMFEARWCERCRRDAAFYAGQDDPGCEIHARALAHNVGDAGYPDEWVRTADVPFNEWNPRCTAFEPELSEAMTGGGVDIDEAARGRRPLLDSSTVWVERWGRAR